MIIFALSVLLLVFVLFLVVRMKKDSSSPYSPYDEDVFSKIEEEERLTSLRDWVFESDVLPKGMNWRSERALKELGCSFSGTTKEDSDFQYAVLPKGWTKKIEKEELYLLDEKRRNRGWISIALFGNPFLSLYGRYHTSIQEIDVVHQVETRKFFWWKKMEEYTAKEDIVVVEDLLERCIVFTPSSQNYNESEKEAEEWLDKNYALWQDPLAYWE